MAATLLITGGSGYLGWQLGLQAVRSCRVVTSYLHHPMTPPGCEAVRLDICDGPGVAGLVNALRPDVIIHTAFDMTSPAAMRAVIVEGTRHVASAAAATGARLVHLSSDMVFDGDHAPYTEADPPLPITPYGEAKAETEQIVAALCPGSAIVRTSLIYGFDPPDPRTLWVLASLRGGPAIRLFTDEIRCPVWVDQLAAAVLELAMSEEAGVWHLAGPQPLNRLQLAQRLAHAYGLDPSGLVPGLSRDSGTVRPLDLTLDVTKALARLRAPLWGVDAVLARLSPLAR